VNALAPYRSRHPGLPDLLNYAAVVADGVVLNKDGSLLAGWHYRGDDHASATDEERNGTSTRLNDALARLGSGWMLHVDAIRLPAGDYPDPGDSHFADPVSRLIDAERRAQFRAEGAHFESHFALVVTYLPPLRQQSRVAEMMYADDSGGRTARDRTADRHLAYFEERIAELEDALAGCVRIKRMQGRPHTDAAGRTHVADELLEYLNYCITGALHPVNLPPCPMYLDAVIGSRELHTGLTPKIEDQFIFPLSIDGFPMESHPGILAALGHFAMEYRWSTRFIALDAVDAQAELRRYQRKWQQKVRGFVDQVFRTNRGQVDQDAVIMAGDVDDALTEASSGVVTYGFYTSVILLRHRSREHLELVAREVRRTVQNLGFSCRFETVNAVESWLGTLPGHGVQNIRRPMMHTLHLADLLPVSAVWTGEPVCPCPFYPPASPPLLYAATEGATPFRLNLHVGDLGHTLIVGPTGSGKSTLLGLIAAQFRRYAGATVYAFDKGRSMLPLVKACGGRHHDIAGDGSALAFAPLSLIHEEAEAAWAEEWIGSLVELQKVALLPAHRNEIHRAVRLLAEAPPGARSLTALVATLQDQNLRDALQPYTLSGHIGKLLDSETDNLRLTDFQVLEIEELMQLGDRNVLPVLAYLFHRIEQSLRGQPALLILDEAWLMMAHPVFSAKIREWLKVLRKANCAVVLATQSLSDAAKSTLLDVIVESCPTKILLPNKEAQLAGAGGVLGPREFYAMLGLNDRQVEIIKDAVPKRQYYYWSNEGCRLIDLNLGPVALSFIGASGKRDLARVNELASAHGADWPAHWLRERGVDVSALSP